MRKIKGVATANSEFTDFLNKENHGILSSKISRKILGYVGSQRLLVNLSLEGFEIALVNSEDIYVDQNNNLKFKQVFAYDSFSKKLISEEVTEKIYDEIHLPFLEKMCMLMPLMVSGRVNVYG